MRKLLLTLSVLALGVGGAFLAFSPRAGAHTLLDGTFTGSVGTSGSPDAFVISLNNPAWVKPGTYQFNITDYSTIHNFDLCTGKFCTGSNSLGATDIAGTGSAQWTLSLAPGWYTYQCDAHSTQLKRQFLVSTTPPVGLKIVSVIPKRKLVTVTAKANQPVTFTAWLFKGTKKLATTTATGTSAILKLKPVPALNPGSYVVQVKAAGPDAANFKIARKKISVM